MLAKRWLAWGFLRMRDKKILRIPLRRFSCKIKEIAKRFLVGGGAVFQVSLVCFNALQHYAAMAEAQGHPWSF